MTRPKKVYTIDTAFAKANSLSFSKDEGRLLENMVFLELRRNDSEIYYFREHGECDFIVKNGTTITHIVQVCQVVHYDNYEREVGGLLEALNFFEQNEGVIITLDQDDVLKEEGKTIRMIPAWKWFGDEV